MNAFNGIYCNIRLFLSKRFTDSMMFQYYIKIVPTMYIKLSGETIHTNQFSVTRHSKSVSVVSGESGMPGIFFNYELSPLMVKYSEKEK